MATLHSQARKWIYPKIGVAKLKDFNATDADRFFNELAKSLSKRPLMMIKSTLRRSIENDSRVIRNKAKIRATVDNAREVLAILDEYGSVRGYLASVPDAGAAAADMRRRFKFLGDTGVWRLLTSASRDIG